MAETLIATVDNVKFINGVTEMNQANWQEYFASQFRNRIIDGLTPSASSSGISVADGSVIVNGIYAKTAFTNGSVSLSYSGYDAFVCLRVYLNEERVELVEKYNIAASSTSQNIQTEAGNFMADESYQCTRNDTIYEIPIIYAGKDYFSSGVDLRKFGVRSENYFESGTLARHVFTSKNNYIIGVPNTGVDTLIPGLINVVDEADDVDIYFYDNNVSHTGATFTISRYAYTGLDQKLTLYSGMITLRYDSAEWTWDSTTQCIKRVIAGGSGLTHIKLKLIGSSVVDNSGNKYPAKEYAVIVM